MHVTRAPITQPPPAPILRLSSSGVTPTDDASEAYDIAERIMRCRVRRGSRVVEPPR
jgi:hypothetical protein